MIIKAGVEQLGLGIGSLGTAGIAAYSLKRVLDTPFDPEVCIRSLAQARLLCAWTRRDTVPTTGAACKGSILLLVLLSWAFNDLAGLARQEKLASFDFAFGVLRNVGIHAGVSQQLCVRVVPFYSTARVLQSAVAALL